jgi:cytochrome c
LEFDRNPGKDSQSANAASDSAKLNRATRKPKEPCVINRTLLPIALAALLASGAGAALAADTVAGEAVFKSQCSICHAVQPGRTIVGPSLAGVVGRPAGQVADFHYSAANKDSGLTWDAATLDRYLTSPSKVVPHTIMTYAGLKDAGKRADLIAYLGTVH